MIRERKEPYIPGVFLWYMYLCMFTYKCTFVHQQYDLPSIPEVMNTFKYLTALATKQFQILPAYLYVLYI